MQVECMRVVVERGMVEDGNRAEAALVVVLREESKLSLMLPLLLL